VPEFREVLGFPCGSIRKIHAQADAKDYRVATVMASTGAAPSPPDRPRVFSLRAKLVLLAAGLVLVPAAVYGVISLSSSRAALTQVIGRQLVEEARSGADRLAGALRSEHERLRALAAQDVMREIRIADLDKRIAGLLVSVQRSCAACTGLAVLDAGGHVVAASHPGWLGKTADALPGGAGAGGVIEGPLRTAGEPAALLRFTVPVPDPDKADASLGWLMALMDWDRELAVLAHERDSLLSVGLDVEVLVLDAGGVMIGGAGRERGPWRLGDRIAAAGPADAVEGRLDERAGMLLGQAELGPGLPLWSVVVATPLDEAHAPARRMAQQLATALAATLAVALALALLAARRATLALTELTDAARAVGRGERPAGAVEVRSSDEIGILAEAFNRMAADLKRAERELVDAAKFSFVGELASGVAHEVRTPLGVLRSSAQILERSLPVRDEESRELLRMLRDEVDRIEHVVSGLLNLGRPREKRIESAPLGPILARAAAFVEPQAREKQLALVCVPALFDPPVACDPELIYQVVLNLLVNAVQVLSPPGRIEVRRLPAERGQAGFEVRDNGPGMSEQVRARIFEPYFTRREGGTGLGLTFVQRVVQEHRGRVTVDSATGIGTTFRIHLPLGEAS
jgi:signal transduction histidine kinase